MVRLLTVCAHDSHSSADTSVRAAVGCFPLRLMEHSRGRDFADGAVLQVVATVTAQNGGGFGQPRAGFYRDDRPAAAEFLLVEPSLLFGDAQPGHRAENS